MVWEIILAVILAIGIGTAFNEVRLKRAAHENKAKAVKSKRVPDTKALNKKPKNRMG